MYSILVNNNNALYTFQILKPFDKKAKYLYGGMTFGNSILTAVKAASVKT